MGRTPEGWLLRGLAVVGLIALFALQVLVRPLREGSFPTPVVTSEPEEASAGDTARAFAGRVQYDSTPTYVVITATSATITPPFTPRPTPTLASIASSTPVSTSGPTPTAPPVSTPTATPTPFRIADSDLAGRFERGSYVSQVTGGRESYRIYLPPGYGRTDQRYPVLYLLHGWPHEEADWNGLGVHEAADSGMVSGVLPPFIIVMPEADELYVDSSGGGQSFEGQVVDDLLPHVDQTYRTWRERQGRAIGGISRGGVWALEIAFRHADLFSAIGAHSPALSANRAPPAYDPFVLMRRPGVAALRIYLSAGDQDWTWESTRALHTALDEEGIANQFVVHSGGHRDELWEVNLAGYLAFYTVGW